MQLVQTNDILDTQDIQKIIVDRYLSHKRGRTLKEYKRNLERFFNWLKDSGEFELRADTLAGYKMHLEVKGLKANTINTYIAPLTDFCAWCAEYGYLDYNPAKYLKRVKKTKVDKARALTSDEVRALVSATSKDSIKAHSERLFILLLFHLGLRVSECINLTLNDFCLDEGTVTIHGKGDKIRVLGTSSVLIDEVKEYCLVSGIPADYPLVQGTNTVLKSAPVSVQHASRLIKRLASKAGIDTKGIKSHSGRVTAINYLLDSEVTLRDAANFAGHSSVKTTQEYDRKAQDKIIQTSKIISYSDKN
jgi:integrase/recombinase XerD